LHPEHARPIHFPSEKAIALGQRVRNGKHRHSTIVVGKRIEQRIDYRWRTERARGIVHQDNAFADGLETSADAVGALRSPRDQASDVHIAQRSRRERILTGANHNADGIDTRMRDQGLDRAPQHGPASKQSILLWHLTAQASSLAGGNNEGGDGFGHCRTALLSIGEAGKGPD
jgi:hypothetical protein